MRLLKLLFAFAVCLSLCVVVFAHPGRTDSKGGHTNHSTGEYHYHHGYSAHQHYDLDGDGTLDCKYSFDDKTGSSSNNASSKTPSNSSAKAKPSTEKTTSTKNSKTLWEYIWEALDIGIIFVLFWMGLYFGWDLFKRLFKR